MGHPCNKTLSAGRRTVAWSLLSLLAAYLVWLPVHTATEAHCHIVVHDQERHHHHHHDGDGHDHDRGDSEDPGHSHHSADAHTLKALKTDSLDLDRVPAALAWRDIAPTPPSQRLAHAETARVNPGRAPRGPASSRAPPRA